MKRSTKKLIIIAILSLMVLSITAGIYLYNKGPMDVKSVRGIRVSATELYNLFTTDSVFAGKKFTGRVVQVEGEVTRISSNNSNQKVLLIKTGTDGAYVNCTLEGPDMNTALSHTIRIKGICSGIGQGDADLGIPGDVYVTRCYIATN